MSYDCYIQITEADDWVKLSGLNDYEIRGIVKLLKAWHQETNEPVFIQESETGYTFYNSSTQESYVNASSMRRLILSSTQQDKFWDIWDTAYKILAEDFGDTQNAWDYIKSEVREGNIGSGDASVMLNDIVDTYNL